MQIKCNSIGQRSEQIKMEYPQICIMMLILSVEAGKRINDYVVS